MQISIVIVEYRCMEQIKGCLPTLEKYLESAEWECIIISNSEYEPAEFDVCRDSVKKLSSRARVVANDKNRGYAGGVNKVLASCQAPYVFVLNPDCRLLDDRIANLLQILDENPDIGVVGPRVVYGDGSLQPSCRRFPKPWTFLLVRSFGGRFPGAYRERQRYFMEGFDHKSNLDVDWLSGGALLVRKSAIESVGLLDERFFLYMEDVDWCRRFWRAGWRVVYTPESTICHDAQHDSLRGILNMLSSPHTRFHLSSLFKYFLKYNFKSSDDRAGEDNGR